MRVILALVLIIVLFFGWRYLQDSRKERLERYWISECKKMIEPLVVGAAGVGSLQPDEASFFKLLFLLNKASAAGMDTSKMVSDACDELSFPEGQADLAKEGIRAAYDEAGRLKLFDDIGNIVGMERGQTPLVKLPGWEDEKAVFGQIVPVTYAPEAARQISNLQLLPASIRDAQGDRVTKAIESKAVFLENSRVITRESKERVLAAMKQSP